MVSLRPVWVIYVSETRVREGLSDLCIPVTHFQGQHHGGVRDEACVSGCGQGLTSSPASCVPSAKSLSLLVAPIFPSIKMELKQPFPEQLEGLLVILQPSDSVSCQLRIYNLQAGRDGSHTSPQLLERGRSQSVLT